MLQNLILLPEVLLQIVLHLDSPNLVNCRQVSTEWLNILDLTSSLWSDFILANDSVKWKHEMLEFFDKKSTSKLKRIEIHTDITGGFKRTPNWMTPFDGITDYSARLVRTMLNSKETLRTFIYCPVSRDGEIGIDLLPIVLQLPRLVTFILQGSFEGQRKALNPSIYSEPIRASLNANKSAYSLRRLSLPISWDSKSMEEDMHKIVPTLRKVSNSLEFLSISETGLRALDGSITFPNLRTLELSLSSSSHSHLIPIEHLCPRLHRIILNAYEVVRNTYTDLFEVKVDELWLNGLSSLDLLEGNGSLASSFAQVLLARAMLQVSVLGISDSFLMRDISLETIISSLELAKKVELPLKKLFISTDRFSPSLIPQLREAVIHLIDFKLHSEYSF